MPGEGIYAIKYAAEMGFDGMQLEVAHTQREIIEAKKASKTPFWRMERNTVYNFPLYVLNDLMVDGFVRLCGSDQYKIAQETMEQGLEIAKYMKLDDVMVLQFRGNEITDDETFEQTVEELVRFCKSD